MVQGTSCPSVYSSMRSKVMRVCVLFMLIGFKVVLLWSTHKIPEQGRMSYCIRIIHTPGEAIVSLFAFT